MNLLRDRLRNTKSTPRRRQPPGSPLSWSTKRHSSANKALPLIYVSSPLLPFFGWDSLNEVFVLRPKLEMPSKKSSKKTLPSSAPCRNLRCTNFHWLSGLLRLNSLVFKAQTPSKGGEGSMSSDRRGRDWDRQTKTRRSVWYFHFRFIQTHEKVWSGQLQVQKQNINVFGSFNVIERLTEKSIIFCNTIKLLLKSIKSLFTHTQNVFSAGWIMRLQAKQTTSLKAAARLIVIHRQWYRHFMNAIKTWQWMERHLMDGHFTIGTLYTAQKS